MPLCPLLLLTAAYGVQVTFLEGASGLLVCQAVLAHMNGDTEAVHSLVQVRGGLSYMCLGRFLLLGQVCG